MSEERRQLESTSPPHGQDAPALGLDDSRVAVALEEYLAAAEAGQPPERHGFLARHAEIAAALAECLDGLEALHVASSAPLNPIATGSHSPGQAAGELPGLALGDFRIVREIGRGGMGVVYEAEQLSLGRRVALKVLPFAAALDTRQLQRFKNEAQAAAHLHHQNIVPVYAVGAERGVHYYAMQLIEGQNLAHMIEELRLPLADRPAKSAIRNPNSAIVAETHPNFGARLSTQKSGRPGDFFRTVAKLVAQAAEALEYAHAMGVIHRDVKPANLMVDFRGNLWVTDFGLAQFLASAGLTQTGDLLGTLRYMSPEQAGGKTVAIDQRTDIYSLGATLYELLTLRPIFDGADRQRLLNQILDEEPLPLRSVDAAMPTELETIVLKAVSKSPADRYASAQEFADDLHRFLENQPIRARRPTVAQLARKWGQRHPSVVVATIVVLFFIAAASLLSTALIGAEQGKAKVAAQRERERAEQAEKSLKIARDAVDEIILVSEAELIDKPGMERVRNRLLESALKYYEQFIEERRDDPNAQADLAVTKTHIEKILADLTALQSSGQFDLLKNADVLNDIHATAEQKTRIATLYRGLDEQLHEWFERSRQLTGRERPKPILKIAEMAVAKEAAAREILTAEQLRRLKQIELQRKELAAFRDPEVVASLKLTDAQKELIRSLEGDGFCGPEKHGPGGHKPDQDRRPGFEKVKDVVKGMSAEQAVRWKEMIGEPFKGKLFGPGLSPPPGPPPGPG